jgi:hypothetical protein
MPIKIEKQLLQDIDKIVLRFWKKNKSTGIDSIYLPF